MPELAANTGEKCDSNDCPRKRVTKGFCQKHYYRWKKYGDPGKIKYRTDCSVAGCPRRHALLGFCNLHWQRSKRGYEMNAPVQPKKRAQTRQHWIDRLLRYREITPEGCWNFTGYISPQGYGRFAVNGKLYKANRLAAMLWLGLEQDSPLYALHKCHNRKCFNPRHLYIGTQIENMQDRGLRDILCRL